MREGAGEVAVRGCTVNAKDVIPGATREMKNRVLKVLCSDHFGVRAKFQISPAAAVQQQQQ